VSIAISIWNHEFRLAAWQFPHPVNPVNPVQTLPNSIFPTVSPRSTGYRMIS
jgi:hypothetical protein